MARTFASSDLVQLPKLDASSAQALGKEVIVAAKGEGLPGPVADALADLSRAHAALERAVAVRLPTSSGSDPARTRAADRALDAAWSALYDVVRGWSRLPDHPQGAAAVALLPKIFPEGVKFVLLPFKLEWAESSTRLRLIKDGALEDALDKLGCGGLLQQIRQAHGDYGDALGVTTVAEADPVATATTVREALDAFKGALCDYIVRVAASTDRRDPKTGALAQALLAPIQRWETPGGAGKLAPPPETPPAPAPVAAPPQSIAPPRTAESPPKN